MEKYLNIQSHAHVLNMTMKKKIKKDMIRAIIESLYVSEKNDDIKERLAMLYSAMVPKAKNFKTNKVAWVGLARSKDKYSLKEYKNIMVYNGYAIATEGFRIHFLKLSEEQASKFNGKFVDEYFNILHVDDVDEKFDTRIADKCMIYIHRERQAKHSIKIKDCNVVMHKGVEVYDIKISGFNCKLRRKHVDQFLNGGQTFKAYVNKDYNGEEVLIKINNDDGQGGILMPIR